MGVMKELSIEEKAKAYDEAVINGSRLWEGDIITRESYEYIFPELKESEESYDERIKKAIKYGLDYVFTNNTTVFEVTKEQCLAWLEKQGEERKITHEEICKSYGIPDIGEFSDGYHTFNGLYKQRMILFAVLVKTYKDRAWKSWKHEDGLDCFGGGWFIVGIDTPAGTYTYHYEAKDWDRFDCQILEKAKHWDGHDESDVERLFSLVSNTNKDEVIKCLINGMKFYYEDNAEATWGTEKFSMKVKDILSWLEKQGNIDMGISDTTKQKLKDNLDNALEKETPESWNEFLEKQGEQKPVDPDTLIQQRVDALADIVAEQKSADKAEPKFRESEWITNGDYTWKVVEVKPLDYILQSQDGNVVDDTISHVDEQFHSFTPEDAKDGDVLVASDGSIFLFKCTIDCACKHYVALTTDGVVKFNEGLEHYWETSTAVHPATKKQRDLLFKKMHEAGYEWDAEKMKLKKISQRMISAEAKEAMYDKPEWSEEDMKVIKEIIFLLKYYNSNETVTTIHSIEDMINWLKSLKDRVQPKQEWSEEDKKLINDTCHLINTLASGYGEKVTEPITLLGTQMIASIKDRLRALVDNRPQNTWKPSEEQMNALSKAIAFVFDSNSDVKHSLESLYNELKKL